MRQIERVQAERTKHGTMRVSGKILLRSLIIVLVMIAASGALLMYLAWDLLGDDPLDRYELIRIVSDARGQQQALVYSHYYADAGTTVTAIWISQGGQPSPATKRPRGKLVFIWSGTPQQVRPAWIPENDHLLIEITGPVDVRSDSGDFNKCYFGYDNNDLFPGNLVCYQSKQVDFRARQGRD